MSKVKSSTTNSTNILPISSHKDSKNSISSSMFGQSLSSAVTNKKDLTLQSQITKKRSALGNISNATGSSTTNNLTNCNTGTNSSINSASSTKEVSKKSRFGVQDPNSVIVNATSTLPVTSGKTRSAQKKTLVAYCQIHF